MINITNTPQQGLSKWNAAHDPVRFQFKRIDYTDFLIWDNNLNNNLGGIRIRINTSEFFERFGIVAEGRRVTSLYIDAPPYKGVYSGFIDNVQEEFVRILIPSQDFLGGASSGYVNTDAARLNWRCEVRVYRKDTPEDILVSKAASFSSRPSGEVEGDIQSWLSQQITSQTNYDYGSENKRNPFTSGNYYIRYRESWVGQNKPFILFDKIFSFSHSKHQLMQAGNGNMLEFVPAGNFVKNYNFVNEAENWNPSSGVYFEDEKAKYDWGALETGVKIITQQANIKPNNEYYYIFHPLTSNTAERFKVVIGDVETGNILGGEVATGKLTPEADGSVGIKITKQSETATGYTSEVGYLWVMEVPENNALFLSDFPEPVLFDGFPFSLSFIWADTIKDVQVKRVQDDVDSAQLDYDQINYVNEMKVVVPETGASTDVWLEIREVETGQVFDTNTELEADHTFESDVMSEEEDSQEVDQEISLTPQLTTG